MKPTAWRCSRCDSFGGKNPDEAPHCECDETEDGLCEQITRLISALAAMQAERDGYDKRIDGWISVAKDWQRQCLEAQDERDEARATCAQQRRELERLRPVYEAAQAVSKIREQQRALGDLEYDQLDGPLGDALDAIDSALAQRSGK